MTKGPAPNLNRWQCEALRTLAESSDAVWSYAAEMYPLKKLGYVTQQADWGHPCWQITDAGRAVLLEVTA